MFAMIDDDHYRAEGEALEKEWGEGTALTATLVRFLPEVPLSSVEITAELKTPLTLAPFGWEDNPVVPCRRVPAKHG